MVRSVSDENDRPRNTFCGRTRREFLERLSFEMGRAFENVDVAEVLRSLLEGRTLEVKAEIKLAASDAPTPTKLQVALKPDPET